MKGRFYCHDASTEYYVFDDEHKILCKIATLVEI